MESSLKKLKEKTDLSFDETKDIFFGHKFISSTGIEYGSVMGVHSNEKQYRNH